MCYTHSPRNGIPHPNNDFAKMEVLFVYSLRSGGAHVSIVLIMIVATSLRESKSFFSGLADGNRRKGFFAWPPASGGGCPGGSPSAWALLPVASFLLMNMLFVLF